MFNPKNETVFGRFASNFGILYESEYNKEYPVPFKKLPEKEQKRALKYEAEFHPSSGPFCPLQHVFNRLTQSTTPRIGKASMSMDLILNVGTTMHSAWQNGLARTERLLGNYVCVKCKHEHTLTTLPRKCKGCGNRGAYAFWYKELGGLYKNVISWHTDGIWIGPGEKLWQIDFKSSSSYAVDGYKMDVQKGKKPSLPYNTNRFQIETYSYMTRRNLGLDIVGYGLPYIARDKPGFGYAIVGAELRTKDHTRIAERTEKVVKDFRRVANILTESRTDRRDTIEWAVQHKLCDCLETYERDVHNRYQPCPLAPVCFSRRKLEAALKDLPRSKTLTEWLPGESK